MILVDTSALVAASRRAETEHARARDAFTALAGEQLALPATIVAECMMVVKHRAGLIAQRRFWDSLAAGGFDLLEMDWELLRDARAIDEHYGDCLFGFADAMLLASCERERCARILTFDRKLAAYRPTFAHALELLP